MDSVSYLHFDINLTYVTIFTLLGMFISFMHVPKESQFSGYRKSRLTLGSAFFFMAICCVVRFLMPEHHNDYFNFWVLSTVSLIFAWLNYTSFLYLIDAEYELRKNFFFDGIIPAALMVVIGVTGQCIHEEAREWCEWALGVVFLAKCIRMFYICEREWRRVNNEQKNYYDEEVDIRWMRTLIWLTLALSVSTFSALYIPRLHFINDYVAPLVYAYMTFKILNYLPRKIDDMRCRGMEESTSEENSTDEDPVPLKINGLEEKLAPFVARWVEDKQYRTPNLSIKEVAIQMGTNHNYLSQYLNSCLGVTFQTWLNTLRIEDSKKILATENISIEEVGVKVGIPESYNFSRWFKVVTGTTPFRYRKEENTKRQATAS